MFGRRLAFAGRRGPAGCLRRPNASSNLPFAQSVPPLQRLSNRGPELSEPPIVRAVNGVVRFPLVVADNPATGEPAFQYRRQIDVAPTIEVRPGETIDVDLHNHLSAHIPPDEVTESMGMDAKTGLQQDVNLHFHGLGSSPRRPGDDVLTMLALPGKSLHYVVSVPANQEPGLYWYHAHVHGEVNYPSRRERALRSAVIVEGLERHFPGATLR